MKDAALAASFFCYQRIRKKKKQGDAPWLDKHPTGQYNKNRYGQLYHCQRLRYATGYSICITRC